MQNFEPWTVVRVPFPYADRPIVQHRPALVLAAPVEAEGLPLLWVAMVTSADHRPWPSDVLVTDLVAAGLPAPSVVRCARVATIDALLAEPLGVLSPRDQVDVSARIRTLLSAALGG